MSICECPLGDRLCDGALPRSGKPIQPVDWGLSEVRFPVLDLVQNGSAGSLETTSTATMSILCLPCTADIIKDSRLGCRRFGSGAGDKREK